MIKQILAFALVVGIVLFVFRDRIVFLMPPTATMVNGTVVVLGEGQVYIEADNEIIILSEECQQYVDYFRKHPNNLPGLIRQECEVK